MNLYCCKKFCIFIRYVTYLPVDGGAASTTLEIGNQQQPQPGKPQQPSGKSASSRAPTTGAFDNVSESGSDDVSSERSWVLRAEQDNLTGRNIVYMKKMLHPKLQAIFDKPVKPGDYSTQTLPARGHHNHNGTFFQHFLCDTLSKMTLDISIFPFAVHGHHHVTGVIKGGGSSSDEPRSISQSLALINHSLGEVTQQQAAASAPPEGAGGGAGSGAASVLAPPPGFSDSEATFSDTDSFSSNGSQFRSGSKTLDSIQSLNHQLGAKDNLMTRSMGPQLDLGAGSAHVQAHHHLPHQQHQAPPKKNRVTFAKTIMSASTSEFDMNKNGGSSGAGAKKEFRNKPLIGWSVGDVCDWLDSLFMPEYKPAFVQSEVDGFKLASITKGELEAMGVIRVGHMMNIEKSLKRYLTA